MKKRIFSILLALVMVLGMLPVQAFATESEQPSVTLCEVEGCTYEAGHEGNCSNYIAPTEACATDGCTYGANHEGNCSNYIAPTEACATDGCTYGANHEGNCSNYIAPTEACTTDGCTYGANHEGNCGNFVEPSADETAAQQVVDLIAAIGTVTLESEAAISAADTAYNALTDTQKTLVANLDVLEAAKTAYMALSVPAPVLTEPAKPVLNVMVNNSSNAANGDPQKAVLGEDGILRIENRSKKPTYLWLGTENGASVTGLQYIQGLLLTNIDPAANKRTSNNVFDGTTYQAYYYSSKYQLPLVAKATVTAADGVTTADYYIIVSEGTAGMYMNAITGFTADNTSYNADSGITFTQASSTVTLTPVTTSIGSGEAQRVDWTWKSSDPTVATVDANGKVTCIGGGAATITATYHRVTASCTVTSTAPEHNVHSYTDGACSVCGTKEPKAISAQFSLVGQNGSFAVGKDSTQLYRVTMSVGDADCDGTVTINDAFLVAHENYSANGAEDYKTEIGSYGLYVTKLWGVETGMVGYFRNDTSVYSITEALKKNDDLVAFFYRDTTDYSDLYPYFSEDSVTGVVNQAKTFTILGKDGKIPKNASVRVLDADGETVAALSATVGSDGTFSITFPSAGTYTLEVGGTAEYTGSVWDPSVNDYADKLFTAAPVIPARIQVSVYAQTEKTVHVTLSDGTGNFVTGKNDDELYRIAVKTEDDPANPDGKVTLREVLIELHKQHHPNGTAAVTATDSSITKLWGVSGYGFGYTLNDVFMMGSGTKTGTNGRTFQDKLMGTVVEDNDYFNVWLLQDANGWSDTYTYFNPVNVTAQIGEAVVFTAYGSSMWNSDGEVPAGAAVKVYDSQGAEQTALNTTVGTDGKFSITFPVAGTYRVEVRTSESKYVVPSRCVVTVASAVQTDRLATLKFTSGSGATAAAYTMTPAFDPAVKEYTLVVSDSSSSVYAWATLEAGASGTIEAKYTNTSAAESTVELTSGNAKGQSLSKAVAYGKLDGNTITISIDGTDAYTVKIVRQATLSKLVLTAGEETVTLDPKFNASKYAYTADVKHDAALTVTPTARAKDASFTINGGSATTVKPVWTEHTSDLVIKVSGGEGTVETTYTVHLSQLAAKIEILTPPAKTTYTAGEKFDPTGMTLKATYGDGFTETIQKDAYTYTPTAGLSQTDSYITVSFDGLTVTQPITVPAVFAGSGTQEDPFLIYTAEDYQKLYELVAQGVSFDGQYLKQTADIALPAAWKPIGVLIDPSVGHINKGANMNAFSGNLDGNGKTLTVPEGGLPLLGYVKNASVKNLNIYGKKIAGYGLVNNLEGLGLSGNAITIENVTLKSGSSILKSGLVGTYATNNNYGGCANNFLVTIKNCTVEQGVVIGYQKDQSQIGSFAGRINGSIENCTSYATVYGTDYVGGILGIRDNALGSCSVTGCSFGGTVAATGSHAGGIVGGGYEGYTESTKASGPNGNKTNINHCSVSGSVTGADKVGGIIGGDTYVAQLWSGHTLKNNRFTGTVKAISGTYIGGIIGYYGSLNKFDDITGNYYKSGCGADRGIGGVKYVDTSSTTHETASDTTYLNTETSTSGCPKVTGCAWKKAHNRTDDPLGADASKLCYTDTHTDPIAVELKTSGTYKTEYFTGEALDLSGIVLTVVYNDDSSKTVALKDATISGYDKDKVGQQTVTLSYNGLTANVAVTVSNKETELSITVTVLGDRVHDSDSDGQVHTLADGNLTTWVNAKTVKVGSNATAWDAIQKALDESNLSYTYSWSSVYNSYYVESVNGLGEFTNGDDSGWLCKVNGIHISVGVSAYSLKNGDSIIFHYTDNYNKDYGTMSDSDGEKIENVEKLIDAIGTITLDKADEIAAARKAYDTLTGAQKKEVENYAKLTAAEAKLTQLQKAADEAAAKKVVELIGKLDSKAVTFEADVKAAKDAYDALTADQKKLVSNYSKLAAALKELATEEDKEAAEKVEKLISAIGTVTGNSESKIKAAREAYDKLTDAQKALVENLAVLEAAEETLKALQAIADIEKIYKTTGDYLENLGTPVPGSTGGEWMVIGLSRSGRKIADMDAYYAAVQKHVQENIDENERLHQAKSTDNSRMILALTAIGKDVANVDGHNLLKGLNSMEFVKKQGINGPIWALMAFDSGNYPTPAGDVTREALIQVILDAQLADGGWALSGETSDGDITGMALQALAPYYKRNAGVKAAIDAAVETLSQMQAADGSFGSIDGTSSESIAQVVTGLAALGIDAHTDARFVKNGVSALDALCAFYVEGGGFRHIPDGNLDGMATEQGYYAMTAYFRMLEGKTTLFDMTDVIDMGGDVPLQEQPTEAPTEMTEPVTTEPAPTASEDNSAFPWWLVVVIVVLTGAIVVLLIVAKPKKGRREK